MTHWPDFYAEEKVGTLFVPDTQAAIAQGTAAAQLAPAAHDQRRIALLLVDPQVDFIHADGSLSVPGAVDDTRRTIRWLLQHTGELTTIAASLDSHIPIQIFYPAWWVNRSGEHPPAYTVITSDDVDSQRWQPVFEPEWSISYVHALNEHAKKDLMIWPYHTMIGTPGHSITPALYEAIAYHSAARQSQPRFIHKGMIPKSEFYSLLEPEVKVPDHPQGTLNQAFLDELAGYDAIYVAGQAKSHCVLATLGSVMRYFKDQPDQIAKWRVLTDCMSSVAHPDIDFDALANDTLAGFADQGVTLTTSQAPID